MKNRYPGFSARMLAHNVDLVVMLPFFYLIGYLVENNFILISLCFIFYSVYHSAFEISGWRGTLGKKLQRMKVIDELTEENLPISKIVIRNLLKLLSSALLFSGFVMIAFDKKRRGLHDRIAGSVVIFY